MLDIPVPRLPLCRLRALAQPQAQSAADDTLDPLTSPEQPQETRLESDIAGAERGELSLKPAILASQA